MSITGWKTLILMGLMLGAILFWVAGCSSPSALEEDFGRSVRNNLAQQIINPRANLDTTPAAGLPSKPGENLYEKYEKSFKPEEKKRIEAITTIK